MNSQAGWLKKGSANDMNLELAPSCRANLFFNVGEVVRDHFEVGIVGLGSRVQNANCRIGGLCKTVPPDPDSIVEIVGQDYGIGTKAAISNATYHLGCRRNKQVAENDKSLELLLLKHVLRILRVRLVDCKQVIVKVNDNPATKLSL